MQVWVNPMALGNKGQAADSQSLLDLQPKSEAAAQPSPQPAQPSPALPKPTDARERALLRTAMGNNAAAQGTGSASSAAAAATAQAQLISHSNSGLPSAGALPTQAQAMAWLSRPNTAPAPANLQNVREGTRMGGLVAASLERPALGAPGNPRWGPGQWLRHMGHRRHSTCTLPGGLLARICYKVYLQQFALGAPFMPCALCCCSAPIILLGHTMACL